MGRVSASRTPAAGRQDRDVASNAAWELGPASVDVVQGGFLGGASGPVELLFIGPPIPWLRFGSEASTETALVPTTSYTSRAVDLGPELAHCGVVGAGAAKPTSGNSGCVQYFVQGPKWLTAMRSTSAYGCTCKASL